MEWIISLFGALLRLLLNIVTPITSYFNRERPPCVPPAKNPLLKLSACALAQKIRSGEISSQEVIEAYVERIKEVNPLINAVVDDRFQEALEEAKVCDECIKNGEIDKLELEKNKPLYGVPFTVKEACSLKGLSLTGCTITRKGIKASVDSEVVEAMRNAGAIPLCVTNTPELCVLFETNNYLYGRTGNAYDTRYSAGGSSGGEGAIIGTGCSLLGLGSDLLGSIRVPALFNGVFGHKPTKGVVSTVGHFPYKDDPSFKQFIVLGPMARYAEDLHLSMKILTAKCDRNLELDKPVDLRKLKVFYLEDLGDAVGLYPTVPEIRESIRKAVKHLEDRGSTVKQYPGGSLVHMVEPVLSTVFAMEVPKILIDANNPKHEGQSLIEFLKALLGFSRHTKATIFSILIKDTKGFLTSSKLEKFQLQAEQIRTNFLDLLGENAVFVCPTFPATAPISSTLCLHAMSTVYCAAWNAFGFPSTNVPMGLSKDGLPVGFQVVATPYQDRLCLAVAKELEKEFGGWVPPYSN